MTLTITIEMDNAAFELCNGAEAARILRKLAHMLEHEHLTTDAGSECALRDINGNKVGTAEIADL